MINKIFPIIIVVLFSMSAVAELISKNYVKALFYLFSAGINICTILM